MRRTCNNTINNTKLPLNNSAGFTIIELLVYLALFAIIMGGAISAAFSVVEANARNSTLALLQGEGDFLLGKIGWVVSGAQAITAPAVGTPGNTLSVAKWDTTIGNPLVVTVQGTDLTLSRQGNPAKILNNSNVLVSNVQFSHINASGDGIDPEQVVVSFTLTSHTNSGLTLSKDFSNTIYLRK